MGSELGLGVGGRVRVVDGVEVEVEVEDGWPRG